MLGKLLYFDPNDVKDTQESLKDPVTAYDEIKKRWPKPNTRGKILTTILGYLRANKLPLPAKALTIWKHIHHVLIRNSTTNSGKLSQREESSWVTKEEVLEMQRALWKSRPGAIETLLMSMYVLWPPNRADYGNVRIYMSEKDLPEDLKPWAKIKVPTHKQYTKKPIERVPLFEDEEEEEFHGRTERFVRSESMPRVNFLLMHPTAERWTRSSPEPSYYKEYATSPRLIIMDHKTASSHGRILRVVPPKLAEVLNSSLNANPRKWLFTTSTGRPFSSNHAFTIWMGRRLKALFGGRNVGTNILRHTYISSIDMNSASARELARIAREMGHSEWQQRRYIRKSTIPE